MTRREFLKKHLTATPLLGSFSAGLYRLSTSITSPIQPQLKRASVYGSQSQFLDADPCNFKVLEPAFVQEWWKTQEEYNAWKLRRMGYKQGLISINRGETNER